MVGDQNDELGRIAQLLQTRALTDPQVFDVQSWRATVEPITRPFLKRVQDALGWSDAKPYQAQPTKTKRRYLDSLILEFDHLFAFVAVGMADEPDRDLERSLSWGLGAWVKAENRRSAEDRLRHLGTSGLHLRSINGYRAGDFGGTTLVLYKALSSQALRGRSPTELVREIATDLRHLRERANGEVTMVSNNSELSAQAVSQWLLDKHDLYFTPYQVAAFITALQAKGFVILSGISGTGKTQLAARIAEVVTGKTPELIPVRPDWRDSRSLLGYYNPISERYMSTPVLRQLLADRLFSAWESRGSIDFQGVREAVTAVREGWTHDLRTLVERFEGIDADRLSDDDLHEIWHEQNNGIAHIGQAASHRLEISDDLLRQATGLLMHGTPGARLVASFQFLREHAGRNHFARVVRALALFDLDRTSTIVNAEKLQATLTAVGYPAGFDLRGAIRAGDVESIDGAFAYLRHRIDESFPDLDRYEKAIAPWFIYRQLERTGTEQHAVEADSQYEHRFIILDEMNLARVEYYFAEFLSVLESRRDAETGITEQALPLHGERRAVKDGAEDDPDAVIVPPHIALPPYLYVVGTVNTDETTHAFSPKVLDRAFSIEFSEVNLQLPRFGPK